MLPLAAFVRIPTTLGISTCLTVMGGTMLQACSNSEPELAPPQQTNVAPDRLAPSEPLIGAVQVWGLRVPDGFSVAARYARTVHLSGSRPLLTVLEAFRPQLLTAQIEVTPTRIVVERAYVKDAQERKLLRLEALRDGPLTRVQISDITPEPAVRGSSESEMWERAGRNPDGTLKDPRQVL